VKDGEICWARHPKTFGGDHEWKTSLHQNAWVKYVYKVTANKPWQTEASKEKSSMKTLNKFYVGFILAVAVIPFLLPGGDLMPHAADPQLSRVTFYVYWYDVGKAALEGLDGVKRVEKGFHDLKETNTVYYDPAVITIAEMEAALRKARTYRGMVK
jgi:copper chaperone CopZ